MEASESPRIVMVGCHAEAATPGECRKEMNETTDSHPGEGFRRRSAGKDDKATHTENDSLLCHDAGETDGDKMKGKIVPEIS